MRALAAHLAAPPASRRRRDLALLALGALLLLAWEVSGLDLAVTRLFGTPHGFPWRDAWLTSTLAHQGGRLLAWGAFAFLVADAVRPRIAGPGRAERVRWLGATLACLVLVPALKRLSATSCPWDLQAFGGTAAYVPHWLPGLVDGGPGHCFPSGHATGAFAFVSVYFLLRDHRPRLARACLATALLAGVAFGAAQLARGAHHVSHTLWSAWLCWAVCTAVATWSGRRRRPMPLPRVPTGLPQAR